MYRGTTPNIVLKINNIDFSILSEVWVTLSSPNVSKTWTYSSGRITLNAINKTATLELTQEETLDFDAGKSLIQVRVLSNEGKAYASKISSFRIENILKEGIISCEETT